MEKHTVVEENHQCSGSNLVSKSVESSIKIDSISIDLINDNEKSQAENCEHFSIRGYVSEIRKKDWKICWPFTSDGGSNKRDEHECGLPPLHVPKFRYWRCQNCLWEIGGGGVQNDYGSILKSCSNGFKSTISSSHAPIIHEDVAVLLSDLQHPPEIGILEGKNIDANASANMNNTTEYHPLSCINIKEKNTERTGLTIVHNTELDYNPNKEMHQLTSGISNLMQKTYHTDNIANLKSRCNGSIDICKPCCGHHEVSDTELAGNLNCIVENAAKINEEVKVTPVADEQKQLVASDISAEDCNIVDACNPSRGCGLRSPDMNKFNYASSDSADIMVGNNLCHGNSSGLHRRRTRKVRLLTELLCKNGDGDMKSVPGNISIDDSLLNAIPDASAAGDKHLVPEGRVVIEGNTRRSSGQHRKRKLDQDEEWRPLEKGSPNKARKEVRNLKGDMESTDAITKAFARMNLQTTMKNLSTQHPNDGSVVIGKKKNKKALISYKSSSLVPVQMLVGAGEQTEDVSKSNAADGVLPNPIPKAVTGRETDFVPLSAQRMDRKPSFKKKSKIHRVDDQQDSLIARNHVLREYLTTRKNVDFLHNDPVKVPFHSARDASSEKDLNLSLNRHLAMQRYDMQRNLLVEGTGSSLLTWQEGTVREDQVNKKALESNHVRKFSFASKSASDMHFGKGVHSDMNSKRIAISVPLLDEKQNYTSQVEIGSCSHMQQKNFCNTNSERKAIGIQEQSTVVRKDSGQRANKAPEEGNLDDIPMEIVELMAKHQYERCLPDVEFDRCPTNSAKIFRTINFNKACGNGEVCLVQREATQKQNPHAKNSRNGITKRGENMGPMKQKVDYFCQAGVDQFNMGQLHKTLPEEFQAFSQHQEKSSGIQHCASASGRQNSSQNCKWIGGLVGKRSSHNCLQTSETCYTCMGIPQQNKDTNHIWSSMMPNHVPFLYNIPQKCASFSTNLDVLSKYPSNGHKENMNGDGDLKFLNQRIASIGKQNGNFAGYPFACKHDGIELNKKTMGSLDLYANETIPAMHLLSLMDAGLRSSAPINLDANAKFLKRASIAHDQDPKAFSRLDSGAYKVTSTMKHASYDHHGKNQCAEDSHRHTSAIPVPVGPSSSFQHVNCFKNAIDFTSHVFQEKLKGKGSDLRPHNKGCISQKSASPGGNFGSTCGSIPIHSMQTMFFGASDSATFPLQYCGLENATKHKLEVPNSTRPVCPPKRSSENGNCSVNRNPADFSVPEAGNSYMIAGEDLKFGKEVPFANAYGSPRLVGQKRQKKLPTVKEHRRHLIA